MVTVLPGRHGWSVLRVGGGGEAGDCGSARTTSGGAMNVSVPDPTRQSFFPLASNHYRTRRHELSPLPLRSDVALFPPRATPVVLTSGASLYIASATSILPRSAARRPRRPTKSRVRFLIRNRPDPRACSQTRRAFRVPEVAAVPTVSTITFWACATPWFCAMGGVAIAANGAVARSAPRQLLERERVLVRGAADAAARA